MEMVYSTQRKSHIPTTLQFDTKLYNKSSISVSTGNLVAFTTANELDSSSSNEWGFHVYVADINTPWFSHKVTSNKYPISSLEWDVLGKYLLVCDISGSCQIWTQKDNLLSEWLHLYEVHFSGEHIVRAVFFHNGMKLALVTDKKDVTNYIEKFQRVKVIPSVKQFGGVPADGVMVVTVTGMVGVFLIPADNQLPNPPVTPLAPVQATVLPSTTESLGPSRSYIDTVDISFDSDGHFMVSVTNSECMNISSELVNCYRVSVLKKNDKLSITSMAMPSFFLCDGSSADTTDMKVTHLKWVGTSLLVGMKHVGGSVLEMWKLVEKSTPIHRQFQTQSQTEMFKNDTWAKHSNFKYTSPIFDICTSKFHYGNSSYLFVSMVDNSIHCLHRDTLNRGIASTMLTVPMKNENEHSPKRRRNDSQIGAIAVSHMGHLLMVIDNQGSLFAYKITYPHQDTSGSQMTISYLVSLLEYCLVSGYDALDVFLLIKPSYLDGVVDRLTENFQRQPPPVQQYYYVNFLTMKTNLYRLSIPGQLRAHDLTSLLMLHSILIAFKSLLRPSDLTSFDKGPAENLAMVLSESVTDIEKVVLGLKAKDFAVEKVTLQSLQQLMQWVADLALNILAKLPETRSSRNAGYEISKDIVALNSIRELLVMMRIWGLLEPQSLPVFSRSDESLDTLLQAFKLLTRLSFNPNEPDEILLDDCCILPSQVLIPQLQFIPTQTSVTSPLLSYVNLPVCLEYNVEPVCLKFSPEISVVEGGLCSDNMVDSVRHLQLGKRPPYLRRCTRCGACSSVQSLAKTAAMRAWEQRWSSGCRCGGSWRLQTLD